MRRVDMMGVVPIGVISMTGGLPVFRLLRLLLLLADLTAL